MTIIDAHIHVNGDHPDCVAFMREHDLRFLNVCVNHEGIDWQAEAEEYQALASQHPHLFAWVTTFDLPDWSDSSYIERVLARMERDFEAGALACKFWKNIGMEFRKPDGSFLMIDDPLFDPIYDYLIKVGKPALMHMGEPLACWQPLDEGNPHYGYYSKNPQWHMYNRPEFPSHAQIMGARDRVLARYPRLRVIGAHLASLEYDVRELAARLDRYPNLAVDTSARLHDLALQDSALVRDFFLTYRDRLLFGTDTVQRQPYSSLDAPARQELIATLWARDEASFRYFETDEEMTIRGIQTRGLALPDDVLHKLYYANAVAWYPGL